MFSYLSHLECTQCGKTFPCDRLHNISPCCGKVLFASYDLPRLRKNVDRQTFEHRPGGMWRFSELLPVKEPGHVVSLGEGGTPLLEARGLRRKLGLDRLFIKEEGLNPTGSFKARGIAAAVSRAKELGATGFTMPSAGNAAAYCAQGGLGLKPTFPIWLNIPLSKSSAFFKPLSICETLAVGMAIITP